MDKFIFGWIAGGVISGGLVIYCFGNAKSTIRTYEKTIDTLYTYKQQK